GSEPPFSYRNVLRKNSNGIDLLVKEAKTYLDEGSKSNNDWFNWNGFLYFLWKWIFLLQWITNHSTTSYIKALQLSEDYFKNDIGVEKKDVNSEVEKTKVDNNKVENVIEIFI
ncbi:18503_t:CDS:1, partial [Racocetra fulgida]